MYIGLSKRQLCLILSIYNFGSLYFSNLMLFSKYINIVMYINNVQNILYIFIYYGEGVVWLRAFGCRNKFHLNTRARLSKNEIGWAASHMRARSRSCLAVNHFNYCICFSRRPVSVVHLIHCISDLL